MEFQDSKSLVRVFQYVQEERERERAARFTDDNSEEEMNLIGDDEIEAMRREAEEEERNERQAEVSFLLASHSRVFVVTCRDLIKVCK